MITLIREQYKKAFDSLEVREGFEEDTQRILRSFLAERKNMKNKKLITVLAAVILAAVLTAGTAYAAVRLLTPSQLAESFDDKPLAEAFASEDAVIINETKEAGDYNITLMGIVSGKNISEWDDVDKARSYVAVAVEHADGTPMTLDEDREVKITPLVEGYQPWFVNLFSLCDGGANGHITDGVYYFLYSFETLEMFADREVAFYIYSEGLAPSAEIFSFDEATGAIDYAPEYKGVKGKFPLTLDPSKADPKAAREHLESVGFVLNEDGSINLSE